MSTDKSPVGYGWLEEREKRKRVINLLRQGCTDQWVLREKDRMQIEDYEYSN